MLWEKGPFPITYLFSHLHLQIEMIDCLLDECKIRKERDIWIVSLSPFNSTKRQRYILAYALGHILFHTKKIKKNYINIFNFKEQRKEEQEAKDFAVILLVPTVVISQLFLKKRIFSFQLKQEIHKLSLLYKVSCEVIKYRLEQFSYLFNIEETKSFSFKKLIETLKHLLRIN